MMTPSPAPEEAIRHRRRPNSRTSRTYIEALLSPPLTKDECEEIYALAAKRGEREGHTIALLLRDAIAAWNRRAGGEREAWQPIETAPKDGTTIWAVLRHDLYPGMGRKDLERWNGLQVPLRHPGIYESDGRTWDHGWNIAAPVGHGGFPDEWIAGWRPLPAPPRAALAGQTEGER